MSSHSWDAGTVLFVPRDPVCWVSRCRLAEGRAALVGRGDGSFRATGPVCWASCCVLEADGRPCHPPVFVILRTPPAVRLHWSSRRMPRRSPRTPRAPEDAAAPSSRRMPPGSRRIPVPLGFLCRSGEFLCEPGSPCHPGGCRELHTVGDSVTDLWTNRGAAAISTSVSDLDIGAPGILNDLTIR